MIGIIEIFIIGAFLNIVFKDIGIINNINTVNKNTLKEYLKNRDLEEVKIYEKDGFAEFIFKKIKDFTQFKKIRFPISIREDFTKKLEKIISKNKIDSINITYSNMNVEKYIWYTSLAIFAGYMIYRFLINVSISPSQLKQFDNTFTIVENEKTKFKDVIGLNPVKDDLEQVVSMIKNREEYINYGCEIPKGIVFSGPPGCGKTMLAKALAGEAGVNFISASGGDFMEIYVGMGASRVRKLFDIARSLSPCIVFIDEIDSIGKKRDTNMTSNSELDTTLNSLLNEIDGFKNNDNIMVVAATNLYKTLDNALIRSGRFDKKIIFDLPNIEERKDLFKLYMNNIKTNIDVINNKSSYITALAKRTAGMSGADIKNITKQAILNYMKKNKNFKEKYNNDNEGATFKDFETGIDDISLGMEKKERLTTDEEKNITAHHEAGHAIISYILKECSSPIRVSIIPRGEGALGVTQSEPDENKVCTKEQLLARMSMAYGGKIAEDIIFNITTTGPSSDITTITRIAYAMVTSYGMSDKIGEIDTMSSNNPYKDYISEGMKQKIDEEVYDIKQKIKKGTERLMKKYKKELIQIAELLLEKEEISEKNIFELFKNVSIENSESIKDNI